MYLKTDNNISVTFENLFFCLRMKTIRLPV